MNKKLIIGIIVIIIVAIIAIPQYESYQAETLSKNFNDSLQNVSSIESEVEDKVETINSQNSTDSDELISTINNDLTPKFSEELDILNKTKEYTDNETELEYIELQEKRINLESQNLNNTVTTLNALAGYYRGEKSAEEAQNTINEVSNLSAETSTNLTQAYNDIAKLLEENPELNTKLHDLGLIDSFYGTPSNTTNTTNSTNTTNTTS
ncbi:MAG: hypothetical protein LUG89_03120 [Methanosphaera sp.]|nr:hypothetical protein [Methanosphaera sp.]